MQFSGGHKNMRSSEINFPFFHNLLSENPNLKPLVLSPPLSNPLLFQNNNNNNNNNPSPPLPLKNGSNNDVVSANIDNNNNNSPSPNPFLLNPPNNIFMAQNKNKSTNNSGFTFNPFAVVPNPKPFWSDNHRNLVPSQTTFPFPTMNFLDWGSSSSTSSANKDVLPGGDDDVDTESDDRRRDGDSDRSARAETVRRRSERRQLRIRSAKPKRKSNNNNNNCVHVVRRASNAHKKSEIVKGQWTPQEDRQLLQLVGKYGTRKWSKVAKIMKGRVGKQCRERWHNHLRPDIRKDTWSEEEDLILIRAHMEVGNRWAEIARRLPGRSENTIKNHWNATKRRQNAKKMRNRDFDAVPNVSRLQAYIRSISNPAAARNDIPNVVVPNNNYNFFNFNVNVEIQNDNNNNDENYDDIDEGVVGVAEENDNNNNGDVEGFGDDQSSEEYGSDDVDEAAVNDKSLYNANYAYKSFLEEMSLADQNENSVDFQMRTEIENLMKGPGEVNQEMDLLTMIVQGRL